MRDTPSSARSGGRRLARGLEDVSYLFLSRMPAAAAPGNEPQDPPAPEAAPVEHVPAQPAAADAPCGSNDSQPTSFVQKSVDTLEEPGTPSDADDLHLASLVCKSVGALEEGLRVVDASLPLDVGGTVDLVAVDRQNRLVIIDVEREASDALLVRGICHLDWFVRNVPIVRRMYRGLGIDFSSEPRVFLLAPRFSPVVLCAVRRIAPLPVACFGYCTTPPPARAGVSFTRI